MDALDLIGRGAVIALGLGAAVHYHVMASKAERGPVYIKYLLLPSTTGVGLLLVGAGLWSDPAALLVAPWIGTALGLLMLAVHLGLWANGAYACRAMDHAAALKAARQLDAVLGQVRRDALVLGERMTPSTWDALASMEDDPRDNRRKDAS
jgi:hypothetical protein